MASDTTVAAIHEAAHAVVAEHVYPGSADLIRLRPDGTGEMSYRAPAGDEEEGLLLLAGIVAEAIADDCDLDTMLMVTNPGDTDLDKLAALGYCTHPGTIDCQVDDDLADRCEALLRAQWPRVERLAARLMVQPILTGDEIRDIIR